MAPTPKDVQGHILVEKSLLPFLLGFSRIVSFPILRFALRLRPCATTVDLLAPEPLSTPRSRACLALAQRMPILL